MVEVDDRRVSIQLKTDSRCVYSQVEGTTYCSPQFQPPPERPPILGARVKQSSPQLTVTDLLFKMKFSLEQVHSDGSDEMRAWQS
jgi:hypothetical protein